MEFIISEYIKIHPMALVHPERVTDTKERSAIDRITQGYGQPTAFFIERLQRA